jgi:hypothetical protein
MSVTGINKNKGHDMAKTLRVINHNPAFRYQGGSGFWHTVRNDGGVNTMGTIDPADDTTTAPIGTQGDTRGTWVWLTPVGDTSGKYDFVIETDGEADLLAQNLANMSYQFLPSNPPYNTVAPLLKDGVTENPDFDNSGNPDLIKDSIILIGDVTKAQKTNDKCKHFTVTVDGGAIAPASVKKAKAKAKK